MSSGSGSMADTPNAAVRGTATDSYNTTNNSRGYKKSQHNEANASTTYGNIFINWHKRSNSKIADLMELEKLVETDANWDFLSGHLTIADQDVHRSDTRLDCNDPKHFWITKNIDFVQWRSDANPQALHICGPHHRGMEEVSSHIVDQAKETATQSGGITLYYFSSTAPTGQAPASVFAHTLLRQMACSVDAVTSRLIAVGFLKTLFREASQQGLFQLKDVNSLSAAVRTVLALSGYERLWGSALVAAIREAHIRISSITIDGIEDDLLFQNAIFLVKHIMSTDPTFKALFLGPLSGTLYSNPLDFLSRIEHDKERKECLLSLEYDDTRYENITNEHHGSLEWLWNHPQYLKWSTSEASSLLYIEGKPGSGKSTLAKYFEKNLVVKEPRASISTVVNYFYTLRGTEREPTHENMLRSILYRLLDLHESAFFHFQEQFRQTSGKWPYASLKHILSSLASHPFEKPVYLILDAIDESEEKDRENIVSLLSDLCSNDNHCNIKVFLASRPVPQLQGRIEHVIRLQDENKDDIQKFAISFLERLQLPDPILDEATQYIIENAEGVFVWVSLVKTELRRIAGAGYSSGQTMTHLKGLPKELEDFYELMLRRMDGYNLMDTQDGITLFQFVRFSNRPMQAIELQHALAIQPYADGLSKPSHPEFKKNLSESIEARISHCGGGFLEINANNTVQLMHQTAQEFFLRIKQEKRKSKFALNSAEGHSAIATSSIGYLMACFSSANFSNAKTWNSEDFRNYAHYLGEWPLMKYAIPNLKHHHEQGGHQETLRLRIDALIKHLTQQLCSRFLGDWFADQFGARNPVRVVMRAVAKVSLLPVSRRTASEEFGYKILDVAATEGLTRVFETMVNPCTHFAVQNQHETALIAFVRRELLNASRMCLSLGANVNATGTKGRTALHQAGKRGNEAIITMLLMEGAEKTKKDNGGLLALDLALKKFP